MSNDLQIYSFEGRYEINDKDGKRWFEITQSSKMKAFLFVGQMREFDDQGNSEIKDVFKNYKYSRPITDILERIKTKIDNGYERVGGIDVLEHETCNYNKNKKIISNYKAGKNIIEQENGINFLKYIGSSKKPAKKRKITRDDLYESAIPRDSLKDLFGRQVLENDAKCN